MSGRDADSTRLVVSACSSFFSFLERRFWGLRNPFRGSRARPGVDVDGSGDPVSRGAGCPPGRGRAGACGSSGGGHRNGAACPGTAGNHSAGRRYLAHRLEGAPADRPRSRSPRRSSKPSGRRASIPTRRLPQTVSRGAQDGADRETKGRSQELLIAWLKTRLARLCAAIMLDGRLGTVYSWHDLRHAFAEMNASRGLVWLRERLGHSSVSMTERYLRNLLHADTRRM